MSRLLMQEIIDRYEDLYKKIEVYGRFMKRIEKEHELNPIEIATYKEYKLIAEWLKELQHYKDLEEQGRLIVTKYAKGQTVYEVDDETDEIHEYKVATNDVWHDVTSDYCDPWNRLDSFREDSPMVFTTKEEAEKALAELKGKSNE